MVFFKIYFTLMLCLLALTICSIWRFVFYLHCSDLGERQYYTMTETAEFQWETNAVARKNIVMSRCENLNQHGHAFRPLNADPLVNCSIHTCPIFILEKKNALFCNIAKSGSTTIKTDIAEIYNRTDNSSVHLINGEIPRASPEYFSKSEISKYYKFLFVRHPFSRLASCYRDKSSSLIPRLLYKNESAEVSFGEFVEYVLSSELKQDNPHFIPYSSICNPCKMNYDFIGRLENMGNERMELYNIIGFEPKKGKESRPRNLSGSTLHWEELFSQLTRNQLDRLYEKYYMDFKIFDYSPEIFYTFIKD